ncbi:MAG: endoglucanase [Cyclobacteriaceae bacterium]
MSVRYSGTKNCSSDRKALEVFSALEIVNNLSSRALLPAIIQAENYDFQEGMGLEESTDFGGLNLGFTDIADYADYRVFVLTAGDFEMSLRVAGQDQSGRIGIYTVDDNHKETELALVSTPVTGGWQTWQTVSGKVTIPAGIFTL